jgi:hypothetical protein
MMLVWKCLQGVQNSIGKDLTIYNFGSHTGFLVENDWRCYHILERRSQEDGIEEDVELCVEDYVPSAPVLSIETYPLTAYSPQGLSLPGWTVRFPLPRAQAQAQAQAQPQAQVQPLQRQPQPYQ